MVAMIGYMCVIYEQKVCNINREDVADIGDIIAFELHRKDNISRSIDKYGRYNRDTIIRGKQYIGSSIRLPEGE